MKIIAYVRVSTNRQKTSNQVKVLQEYADQENLHIDEFITLEISSRKAEELRRIKELKTKLQAGDILLSTELSRLGRSTVEIIKLVDELTKQGVQIRLLKNSWFSSGENGQLKALDKFILTVFAGIAEMERSLLAERISEGLEYAKTQGRVGGRRVGTLYASIYDKHLPKIKEYLAQGFPLTNIVKLIGEGNAINLSEYLAKRGHRQKKHPISKQPS